MSSFQANPEELIAKGKRIGLIKEAYFLEKSKIYNTGEKIAQTWTGVDSISYLSKLNEYEPDFKKLGEAIEKIELILTSQGERLVNKRDKIAELASNI